VLRHLIVCMLGHGIPPAENSGNLGSASKNKPGGNLMSSELIVVVTIVAANFISFGLGLVIGRMIWSKGPRW